MSVCRDCKERKVGCGATCEKYQAERRARLKQYEDRLKESNVTQAQIEFGRGRRRKR